MRIADTSPFQLAVDWRAYCRAHVLCEVNPGQTSELIGWDHDCTRNAKSELLLLDNLRLPALSELDTALGTSLELFETQPLERAREAIHAAHLA